jgi:hypothetical protein
MMIGKVYCNDDWESLLDRDPAQGRHLGHAQDKDAPSSAKEGGGGGGGTEKGKEKGQGHNMRRDSETLIETNRETEKCRG